MSSSPLFIAGPDRSGTTLLYALIASHPNISMVRRTNYWRWFYGRYGNISNQENFDRLLDRMLRYKRIAPLNPDEDRIRKEFWQAEDQSYGRLFALFHEHNAERIGKTRWGDKSLHTEHYADEVFKEFPEAKIIHTIRDPRDRYTSVRKRFGGDNPRLGASTARWLESIFAARRNKKKYSSNYMILRFEDLVSDPEKICREVCDFIGEDYDPVMLSMEGAVRYKNSGGNSSFEKITPGAISTKPVGRYKKILSGSEISFIQLFAGKIMKEFNYRLERTTLSGKEKARYYFWILPTHFMRMVGWLTLKYVYYKNHANVPASRFEPKKITNTISR